MAGADLTTIDAILKDVYVGTINEQLNNEVVLLRLFEKKPAPFSGRKVVLALHVARNSGVGARGENGTLPTATNQVYIDAVVNTAYNYGQYRLTGQSIAMSKTSEGAFARAMREEATRLVNDFRKNVNRQFYGDGSGTIATLTNSPASSASITFDASKYVFPGQVVDVIHAGAPVSGGTGLTISSVTKAGAPYGPNVTNAAVLSGAITATAGDTVVISGSYNQEVIGLKSAIIDNTSSYLSVSPSSYPAWESVLVGDSSLSNINETTLQFGADSCEDLTSMRPETFITTRGVRRAMFRYLQSLRRFGPFSQGQNQELAGDEFEFDGQKVIVDTDCTLNTLFGLHTPSWGVYQTEQPNWQDDDGTVVHRSLDGTDSVYANFRWYSQIATTERAANFAYQNITEG